MMQSVKTRKQGNSVMITIPKEFNIPVGKDYEPVLSATGEIIFKPIEVIDSREWASVDDYSQLMDKVANEYDDVFRELVDK